MDNTPLTPEFLASVNHGPGIYQMLSRTEVLYVGKAKDLRKRLAQYAHYKGPPQSKTAVMLSHVKRVETILTTTEKEALILEASLIKKHRPRYNVILRDDKNYPLIKVTVKEEWPRVVVTRRRIRDGSRYFGPYASTAAMRITLKLLHSRFPLRRCPTVRQRSRPCLNYQIGQCLAPCAGKVNRAEYLAMVEQVLLILEGRSKELVEQLKDQMTRASMALKFEEAAKLRDQLAALERTLERQMVVDEHRIDQDIFGLHRQGAAVGISLLFIRSGMISGAQSFFLADPLGEDEAILTQVLVQYYSELRQPPRRLLLPFGIEDIDLVTERLAELRGNSLDIHVPQRGKNMQLMQMAADNAATIFAEQEKKNKAWQTLKKALHNALRLSRPPEVIECLDISNTSGRLAVGSLVCFQQGEKTPERFRHYRIQEKEEPDDYAMMREVLTRRLQTGLKKNNLPDLLLLDGGKGQLSVGVQVLRSFDLLNRIDLAAIAKEKQDEGEKLFRPGRKNPLLLAPHSPVLLYLMRIRDESHRFGITFHRRLRTTTSLHSRLDNLTGIGSKRKAALLKYMGSVQRILTATPEELATAPGIGPVLAASLHRQLHSPDAPRPAVKQTGPTTGSSSLRK
ncbi:MAG: excinuclease ABC subunit C [Desulfobulbus propionicus]|nr:MAG: excinuclease ABC subunit C [Desulfobulbus propionicus]